MSKVDKKNKSNPLLEVIARFVLRHRWWLLIANVCITLIMGYIAARTLSIDNSVEAFMGEDAEEVRVLEELYVDFGQDNLFQIVVAGDVFSLDYLKRLKKLHEELAVIAVEKEPSGPTREQQTDMPKSGTAPQPAQNQDDAFGDFEDFNSEKQGSGGAAPEGEGWAKEGGSTVIEEIISLINVRQSSYDAGGLKIGGLLDHWPVQDELAALRKKVLGDELLVGRVVGKEGNHSVVILRAEIGEGDSLEAITDALGEIARRHERPDFRIYVAGYPAFHATLNGMMLEDFRTLTLIATIVMTLIVAILFRNIVGVVAPLLVVWQSAVWTLGFMALSDVPMTMLTNVLPAFLGCVGVGGSIHIMSVYRDMLGRGLSNEEAIVGSIASTGVPVFYTTITTAVGLISFRFATLGAITDMGVFGALGIIITLVQSIFFLPIILSFNKKRYMGRCSGDAKPGMIEGFLGFCNNLSRPQSIGGKTSFRRRNVTLVVSFMVSLAAFIGASMLMVHHNSLEWIPEDRPIRAAMDVMDRHVGGTGNVVLLIEANPEEDISRRELLVGLEKLEQHVRSYRDPVDGQPKVGVATSVLDMIRESNMAVNETKHGFYKLPESQQGIVDMFTLYENAAPAQLRRLVTVDMKRSVMTFNVKWMNAWSYKPLTEHIKAGIKKYIGDKARVKITGTVFGLVTVVGALLTDLLRSFGIAFVTVTLIMIILLRDIKLGLISMVPNLLPVVSVMGVMGFFSIPLDMANLIIASIIIGIAVDDTIHFLHHFKANHETNGDVEQAIDYAFFHTGRAMTSTSIILVLGFFVFCSATMYPLQRFGALSGLAIVFALLYDLIVGPALLRTVFKGGTGDSRN